MIENQEFEWLTFIRVLTKKEEVQEAQFAPSGCSEQPSKTAAP